MKKVTLLIMASLVSLLVTGCVLDPQNKKSLRFNTSVELVEFFSESRGYVEKPTFGEIIENKKGYFYYLKAPKYGTGVSWVIVEKSEVDIWESAIEKYLKWNELATQNKDMIEKEITRYNSPYSMNIRLEFYSGNETTHYLSIKSCQSGLIQICTPMAMLNKKNAILLKKELKLFKNGNLKYEDISSKYN